MTRQIVAAGVILAGLYGVFHVGMNMVHRGSPPPACQIWGGTWGIWSGWNCG